MRIPFLSHGFDDTTVILPTLNEERNIEEVLSLLFNLYPKVRVIVADDGSQDKTQDLVAKMAAHNKSLALIDRSEAAVHGLTASVLDAIGQVESTYFVVMDADLQHPPERIKPLVEKLRTGGHLVVACRTRVAVDWAFHRRLMSLAAMKAGELVLKRRDAALCSDIMSGFFAGETAFVREAIDGKRHRFVGEGYKILYDLLKILPPFTKIDEVPYTFGIRQQGHSKIGKKHILAYLKSLAS